MTRTKLVAWVLLGTTAVATGILVVGCKGSSSSDTSDHICTSGNYVFCRCEDRSEGTKLCTDGTAFAPCVCGSVGDPGPLSPDGDAGFETIDAGPPPPGGPIIDARCVGKLAVLASSDMDINLFAAAYAGNGNWQVGKSQGPALRGTPRGVLVDGVLVAAWRSRYDLIAWTKFQVGQASLTPPVSIGSAASGADPSLALLPSAAKLFYLGANNTHYEGSYSASTGWDNATTAIPSPTGDGGVVVPGKSAPAAAAVGTSSIIGYTGTDTKLARQTYSSGSWGDPIPIASAAAFSQPPAMVAMEGGTKDLLMVYVGADLILHSTTRESSNKAWNTAIVVDTAASPTDPPELTAMPNGRAMVIFKASNSQAYFSVYDPTKTKPWSVPAELVAGKNPAVVNTPSVVEGHCGSDATVAYSESGGGVSVMRYDANGAWTGPFVVPGLTAMTFVGVGELP